jgi:hypothetical protein
MKSLSTLIAAAALATLSTASFADDATQVPASTTNTVSATSRAAVQAELQKARASGELARIHSENSDAGVASAVAPTVSTSRDAVRSEARVAGTLTRNGELGVSFN